MSEWLHRDRCILLRALGATVLAGPLTIYASLLGARNARVVVVGGGYGGTTAVKCVHVFSGGRIDVTLMELNTVFASRPLLNLVLSGDRDPASITMPYDALVERHGVQRVRGRVSAIDPDVKQVRLTGGGTFDYDRLTLSPGIDFVPGAVSGLANATTTA